MSAPIMWEAESLVERPTNRAIANSIFLIISNSILVASLFIDTTYHENVAPKIVFFYKTVKLWIKSIIAINEKITKNLHLNF
jgi:hypothetical protein